MNPDARFRAEDSALRALLASGVEAQLRTLPNVVHVSIGLKETAHRLATDHLCIRVYVRHKAPLAALAPAGRVPGVIHGVPTDVHAVPVCQFQADNTRYRPIMGGIQIANGWIDIAAPGTAPRVTAGTLGCIAIDNTDDAEMFLSAQHVLLAQSMGGGDAVYQPAPVWFPNRQATLPVPNVVANGADKVAVVRRAVLDPLVDAGIARIDVSSCCHCCGVHFSNEINGLSLLGRPAGNTIVGDEAAVAGMTVFKVGAGTRRTEGKVVDIGFPSFTVPGPPPQVFVGQMAIQQVNTAVQFSDVGDSGAAVINLDNKIVGMVFAGGKEVAGAPAGFLTLANHIADIFRILDIRIPYGQDVTVALGPPDRPGAVVTQAQIPAPYRAVRDRMQGQAGTARIFGLGQDHAAEVTRLVNHCRPVMVAWHRVQGPALLATLMGAVRDGHGRMPGPVKGVALHEALARMRAVLAQHGSAALRATLARSDAAAIVAAARDCRNLDALIAQLAAIPPAGEQ